MDHVERTGRGQTPDQTSLVELESQFDFDFEDDQLVKETMYSTVIKRLLRRLFPASDSGTR